LPEDLSNNIPEDMPDRMLDRMPEDMSENMSGRMPEDISDRMPEGIPDKISDKISEDLPITKYINIMVGITRNKINYIIYIFFSLYYIDLNYIISI
jgi:hypothetical protein